MSATFVVFRKDFAVQTNDDGEITSEYSSEDYYEIAFRSNNYGSMWWENELEKIYHILDPKTKVYPIDNTPQGIYTIQDIINEIEK